MNEQLEHFAAQVQQKMQQASAASGPEAERLHAEVAALITETTQQLMQQGVSVAEIQDSLRAATDVVPQTYAPDDTGEDESGDVLEGDVLEVAYFVPMAEAAITDFSAGRLQKEALMQIICDAKYIAQLSPFERMSLNLGQATEGGEIVAGYDGEALIPEWLELRDIDGYSCLVCEPMVYKSAAEARKIAAELAPITAQNIRKQLPWRMSMKRKRALAESLWPDFAALRECYAYAAQNGQPCQK